MEAWKSVTGKRIAGGRLSLGLALLLGVMVASLALLLGRTWLDTGSGDAVAEPGGVSDPASGEPPNATRYPVVLSHHWSGSAETAFLGDDYDPQSDRFATWGIKDALEDAGAVVYQPDKVPYASHENRGRLLYRSCAGESVEERLCEGDDPQPVDGVELAMIDYCGDVEKHGGHYGSYDDCIDEIKVNIICHSQGCPDSRYMISAMTNELSGRPMHEHVASWTSLAGANNGTEVADVGVSVIGPCEDPACGGEEVAGRLAAFGFVFGEEWGPHLHDSIVALSRTYMTETTDVFCDVATEDCPPSFNQRYPNHPDVYYQTYSGQIEWVHPCYEHHAAVWELLSDVEGPNDGYISVESQQFLTSGSSPDDPPTYVVDRGLVTGDATSSDRGHPGLGHMAFSTGKVPGIAELPCSQAEGYYFSREDFYLEIVGELAEMGF